MDPAVIAALIGTPSVLVAAAAAFAAGKAQARAAHRGPVDAVRHQHQRDAYAQLLATAQAFDQTGHQMSIGALPAGLSTSSLTIDLDPLRNAGMAVRLEGPAYLAAFVDRIDTAAADVHAVLIAMALFSDEPLFDGKTPREAWLGVSRALDEAMAGFTDAASGHLNGRPPQGTSEA